MERTTIVKRWRCLGWLLGVVVVGWCMPLEAAGAPTAGNAGFSEIVMLHLERYAALEIQDLYKLAYQAAMGSEHGVPDPEAARRWLERELAELGPDGKGPVTVPLSPDGRLVRVELRAFVARGGDSRRLLEAFVSTAGRFTAATDRLERYWNEIEALVAAGELPFASTDLEIFFAGMRAEGFPPVRHSPHYRELYRPAYRVVLLELLADDVPPMTSE